ncbi:MAG TPA: helix-turn-helix domain-containing protein [Nitrososphaerales archaeon]|nr:helix-turn-helix domain-containing protein [Nitrososphaerales archaeon]
MYQRAEHPPKRTAGAEKIERRFREFGEAASVFVRTVSAEEGISYRGEASAVEDNLNVMKKVFGKWSIEIILSTYSMESVGFGDLRRVLKGISSRVLSKKLKDLEELGFLEKSVIESKPPKVRYNLSEKGELLAKLGEPVIMYLRNSME